MQYTSNYNLKKPDGTDNVDIQDFNDNAQIVDAALTPAADPVKVPASNGAFKLIDWVSYLTNRIKAITGKANWYDAPSKTLEDVNTHISDTTAAHGATSAATASKIIIRDAAGRAKVAVPSAADDIARKDTVDAVQGNLASHLADYVLQVPYGGVTTNVGNAYSIATPVITALTAGMAISIKINADSTGASTLNWNSKGAKPVKKANGSDVTNLKANGIYTLRYDGANFILQGEGGSGNAVAFDLRSGKTMTTDAGDVTGTMPDRTFAATGGNYTPAVSSLTDGTGNLCIRPQEGYYKSEINTGGFGAILLNDPNYVASNVKKDVTFPGGLVGTLDSSVVKSKQTGTATFPSTSNLQSITVTVSAINPNNCILYVYQTSRTGEFSKYAISGDVTNATTLTFSRATNTTGADSIVWELIEFNNVKSRQTGITRGTGAAIVISAVDVNKASCFQSCSNQGYYSVSTSTLGNILHTRIVDSTHVILHGNGSGTPIPPDDAWYRHWQVIEFY